MSRSLTLVGAFLIGCGSSAETGGGTPGAPADAGMADTGAGGRDGSVADAPNQDAAVDGGRDVDAVAVDAGAQPVGIAPYLGGKGSAYSLTFDDNFPSQKGIVLPLLEELGYRATFFLVVDRICEVDDPYCYSLTWVDWQAVHDAGHEIGNHSLTHWFEDPDTTLQENIVGAADILAARIEAPLTFAYPGGAREGTPEEIAEMDSLVLSRHIGWRHGNDKEQTVVNRNFVNFGEGCETDMNGVFDDLLAHAPSESAPHAPTTWLIGLWHGVGEGYCPVSDAQLTDHLQYVAAHDEQVWVAPFADVLRYEMQREATSVVIEEEQGGSVVFSASHGLDARFDLPLTFVVTPAQAPGTTTAVWEASGQPVPAVLNGGRILVTALPTGEALRVSWE